MSLRLISFDAAGTLIRVREPVGETYAAYAARHRIEVAPEALKRAFGALWTQVPPPYWPEGQSSPDDDRGWWRDFAGQVFAHALGSPVAPERFEPLFADLYRHYSQAAAWQIFDDVVPALEALGSTHELCVLSNFDRRLIQILEGLGLRRYFRHIILSSEVGAAKPHPRMFEAALARFGLQPEECLHVGDDDRCDVIGAIESGWYGFAVHRPDSGLDRLVEVCSSHGSPVYRWEGGKLFEVDEKVSAEHIPACIPPKAE